MTCAPYASEGIQKSDQVLFLLSGQVHLEPLIVEIDKLLQIRSGSVMEIGRARSQAAQDWAFATVHIAAFAGDEGFSGIRRIVRNVHRRVRGIGTSGDLIYREI